MNLLGMEITEAVNSFADRKALLSSSTILREVKDPDSGQIKEEKHEIEIVRGEVVLKESGSRPLSNLTEMESSGSCIFSLLSRFRSSSSSDLAQAIESLKRAA